MQKLTLTEKLMIGIFACLLILVTLIGTPFAKVAWYQLGELHDEYKTAYIAQRAQEILDKYPPEEQLRMRMEARKDVERLFEEYKQKKQAKQ